MLFYLNDLFIDLTFMGMNDCRSSSYPACTVSTRMIYRCVRNEIRLPVRNKRTAVAAPHGYHQHRNHALIQTGLHRQRLGCAPYMCCAPVAHFRSITLCPCVHHARQVHKPSKLQLRTPRPPSEATKYARTTCLIGSPRACPCGFPHQTKHQAEVHTQDKR